MKQSLLLRCYRRLLRLYPQAFREQFGDEMLVVFALVLADAAADRPLAVAKMGGCELRGLVNSALREHLKGSSIMERLSLNRLQHFYQPRRLARILGLLLCAIILVPIGSPAPPQNPALIVLLFITHSVVIAWFHERVGGRLLIAAGVLLGLTAMIQWIAGAGIPSEPVPGRAPLLLLTGLVIFCLFSLPVVGTGLLFLRAGRQPESLNRQTELTA